jgi:hypothetical protein
MRSQRIFGWIGVLVMTGLLAYGVYHEWPGRQAPKPAGYTAPTFNEPDDPESKRAFHELCPAINRPEVLRLLEDPAEVHGQGTSHGLDGMSFLMCDVTLQQSSLRLEVGDGLKVSTMRAVSPDSHQLTVLGRPALLENEKGLLYITTLFAARDSMDTGGYAVVTALTPERFVDEAVMVRLAELVLAQVKGWSAA